MSSALVTPTIKLLNGELLSVEVDPALGLEGVRKALNTFDPVTFPLFHTMVHDTDESNPPLTCESLLCAFVKPIHVCRLESVDDVSETLRHWHFMMENGTSLHVYRRAGGLPVMEYYQSFYPVTYANDRPTMSLDNCIYYLRVSSPNGNARDATMKEAYIVHQALLLDELVSEDDRRYPTTSQSEGALCECGYVNPSELIFPSHFQTEEHQEGHPEMKPFMDSVKESLSAIVSSMR